MIIALAGRRVDGAGADPPRFPLGNVELVAARVRKSLELQGATALVSAAACGADLIGLSEAGKQGLRRRIVLPFERQRFRRTSVTDRPGDWGPVYDRILDEVEALGDLVILENLAEAEAFTAANRAILDEAVALGAPGGEAVTAMVVWDGSSRGPKDVTEDFAAAARSRGIPVVEVSTL